MKFIVTRYYDAYETFEIDAENAEDACDIAVNEDRPGHTVSQVTPCNLCSVVVQDDAGVQLASWED